MYIVLITVFFLAEAPIPASDDHALVLGTRRHIDQRQYQGRQVIHHHPDSPCEIVDSEKETGVLAMTSDILTHKL
jgi:hypothetical protein